LTRAGMSTEDESTSKKIRETAGESPYDLIEEEEE